MACPLTTGFLEECDDSLGGIKAGEFMVAQLESITSYTEAAGEISAVSMTVGTQFFVYEMKKEMADALTTGTKDPQTGTQVYETVANAILHKLTKEKNTEFKLLAGKPVVVMYQDQNGTWHCAGIDEGAELLTQTGGTGKELNTQNGYNLAFTAREGHWPFTVDPSIITALKAPAV